MANSDNSGQTQDDSNYIYSYLNDRPIKSNSDLLWKDQNDSTVYSEVKRIARQIVTPLAPELANASGQQAAISREEVSRSMTFAVHGTWGMGKSSVLNMIEEEALKLARQEGVSSELKFCRYEAPAFEYGPTNDARVTLAFRILSEMVGDPLEGMKSLLTEFATVADMKVVPNGADRDSALKHAYILQRMATNLASMIDFGSVIKPRLYNPHMGINRIMVVMVDDLDRCQPQFVWKVLDAIQQFSETPNLFFILAVAKDRLIRSVEAQFGSSVQPVSQGGYSPDYALEKYVQHAIDLPPLEGVILNGYVAGLLDEHSNIPLFNDTFKRNIDLVQRALRIVTPRSVKRCLNTIGPGVKKGLEDAHITDPESDETRQILKQHVLNYVWPDLYRRLYDAAFRQGDVIAQNAFGRLEEIARAQVASSNDEQLKFSLEQFSRQQRQRLDLLGIDLSDAGFDDAKRLMDYLGRPPYWTLDNPSAGSGSASGIGGATGGFGGFGSAGQLRSSSDGGSKGGIVGIQGRNKSDLGNGPMDVLNQFLRLYVESERGYEEGNATASLRAARQLSELVAQNRSAFGQDRSGQVGNIAINAERFRDYDLAVQLYRQSLDLNPEHSNNMQNYADLIITTPLPTLYDEAQVLLEKLNTPPHRDHRPERTLALEAQLRSRLGQAEDTPADAQQVESLIQTFLADPTNVQRYIGLMTLLTQFSDFANMRRITQAMYSSAEDDYGRYVPLRAYADTLAASPDVDNELQAMDIYRFILATFSGPQIEEYRSSILQNYATLLYKHDYDPEAGELWYQAYQLEPNNNSIRNAYSLYLIRANRSDVANLVIDGRSLSEVVKQPQIKRMPERFWSGTDRWWENPKPSSASLN